MQSFFSWETFQEHQSTGVAGVEFFKGNPEKFWAQIRWRNCSNLAKSATDCWFDVFFNQLWAGSPTGDILQYKVKIIAYYFI